MSGLTGQLDVLAGAIIWCAMCSVCHAIGNWQRRREALRRAR